MTGGLANRRLWTVPQEQDLDDGAVLNQTGGMVRRNQKRFSQSCGRNLRGSGLVMETMNGKRMKEQPEGEGTARFLNQKESGRNEVKGRLTGKSRQTITLKDEQTF
jgi:hypothetical protein